MLLITSSLIYQITFIVSFIVLKQTDKYSNFFLDTLQFEGQSESEIRAFFNVQKVTLDSHAKKVTAMEPE